MKTPIPLLLISIFLIAFCHQSYAKDSFPPGANESVTYYFTPDWLNNDEVVYIRIVDYYKRSSSVFAQFDQTDEVFVKRESGIYAYNVNTDKTRFFKSFEKQQLGIEKLSSAKNGDKIALTDNSGRLYVMKKDGSDFKVIFFKKDRTTHLDGSPALAPGSYAVGVHQAWISPDGTKILYSISEYDPLYELETWEGGKRDKLIKTYSTSQLWLINSDGTANRTLTLMAGAIIQAAWYPDGKKILIINDKGSYLINIEDGSREKFIPHGGYSKDSNIYYGHIDGNLVKVEGIHTQDNSSFGPFYYDEDGKMRSFNIPGSPHLSPDGTKVIGVKAEGIVVLDLNNISEKIITGK